MSAAIKYNVQIEIKLNGLNPIPKQASRAETSSAQANDTGETVLPQNKAGGKLAFVDGAPPLTPIQD